jgi:predicted DNA-binding protein (UPF0251 family)
VQGRSHPAESGRSPDRTDRGEEDGVVDVEQWAEIRRMHFVDGVSIREIRRRTGLHRETIRRALAAKRELIAELGYEGGKTILADRAPCRAW